MKNILITGGNGYIARTINNQLRNKYNVFSISRKNFDLTCYNSTHEWFYERQYDVVIHTAVSGGSRLKNDDHDVYKNNMKMFDNLAANKSSFSKLITFGSGAEIFHQDTPYANSKREIAQKIQQLDNFYNLRIFGVFDENELPTRFIKGNIIRSIEGEPMIIHSNKIMDFFYMEDLISLINYYINNDGEKEINCSYEQKYTLKNVADIINNISKKKVPIIIENENDFSFYCGNPKKLPINEIGLEEGIEKTYYKLSRSMLSSCRDMI